ncbi:MAG: PDZ domain-containing protein [Gemmatimonadaceae bacterium]|nr:PDZ domain-containing protein [Gemmatimonadaceae bacterium]
MTSPRISTRLTTAALAVAPFVAPALAGSLFLASPAEAQRDVPLETRVRTLPGVASTIWSRSADRAVLGVTMGAGSSADTAGVKLEAVDDKGPAAKAGLKAGDIVTSINGVSLKVAREDAEDLALAGLAQRRLQRVMAKAKPGDVITLQVRSGAQSRSVPVTTVSEASLAEGEVRRLSRAAAPEDDKRGRVGLAITSMGNARDTLGLFVSSVVTGGPAEKAGVVEGDRIAAVNGVDVRVAKEDVEDMQAGGARADRFIREVQKVEPGKAVTLRVFSGGRYREVSVTAVKSSELPNQGFGVTVGDGQFRIMTPSMPRMPRGTIAPFEMNFPDGRMFLRDGQGVRELRIERNGEEPRVIRVNPEVRIRTRGSGSGS